MQIEKKLPVEIPMNYHFINELQVKSSNTLNILKGLRERNIAKQSKFWEFYLVEIIHWLCSMTQTNPNRGEQMLQMMNEIVEGQKELIAKPLKEQAASIIWSFFQNEAFVERQRYKL